VLVPDIPADARLVAFDLDDTLAPSKSPLDPRMGAALARLLAVVPVCVISGGQFAQFESQLIAGLEASASAQQAAFGFGRLHLMPTCGTQYYRWVDADWRQQYAESLTPEESAAAIAAVEEEAKRLGVWEPDNEGVELWGPVIEDRGTQITFSALGQAAPVDAKKAWDPTNAKKNALAAAVAARLPELEVRSGGSTSIDITAKGIDKAYGMRRLTELSGIPLEQMAFVGDRLDPDGNDYPVLALGIRSVLVHGWQDTAAAIDRFLVARGTGPVSVQR
jgi:HAD superfamily hydrolase (TIGR01484 family)